MANLLNPINSNFSFNFPKKFFPEEIKTKYDLYLRSIPIPFTNLEDYMTSCLQSITWPPINSSTITQSTKSTDKRFSSGHQSYRNVPHEFSIVMKTTDGFFSYLVMHDLLTYYLAQGTTHQAFLEDLIVRVLNQQGLQVVALKFIKPVFKSLSSYELNFTANNSEFRSFSADFECMLTEFTTDLQ